MIKLVTLLTLVTVVWTLVAFRKVDSKLISGSVETSTPTSVTLALAPETLGVATGSGDTTTWKTYTNEKLNFRLKYFNDLQIKKLADGSVVFSKDTLDIAISQQPLSTKDTVNTIAELDINTEMEKRGDKFRLLDSISPIAIGGQTGVTFTTLESGQEITYFYIPERDNYLKIINKTVETDGTNLISLSDDLIYSLEIIEK